MKRPTNQKVTNDRIKELIEIGWQQAKSGQLCTPKAVKENLNARKAVWKILQS